MAVRAAGRKAVVAVHRAVAVAGIAVAGVAAAVRAADIALSAVAGVPIQVVIQVVIQVRVAVVRFFEPAYHIGCRNLHFLHCYRSLHKTSFWPLSSSVGFVLFARLYLV